MGAGVTTETLALSVANTGTPEVEPMPVTVALIGPSGASDPGLVGPGTYRTSPGHNNSPGCVITSGDAKPPIGDISVRTTSNKHSPLDEGTVIW